MPERCWWVPADDALYAAYHDTEWGFPQLDDTRLFEKLSLEGFQAGLSWRTILGRRGGFRSSFGGFDLATVASLGAEDVERLVLDPGIIRHRGKINATIANAAIALDLQREFGSLAALIWRYSPAEPPRSNSEAEVRGRITSPEATALAKFLRKRGWRFLGPTSAYAFCQAVGLVNDHVDDCPVRAQCEAARAALAVP